MDAKFSKMHWSDITKIPSEELDYETCKFFVQQNGQALAGVPLRFRDREMSGLAMKTSGWAMQYVPNHILSAEMVDTGLRQDPASYIYVPQNVSPKEAVRDGSQAEFEENLARVVRDKMTDIGMATLTVQDEERVLDTLISAQLGVRMTEEDLAVIRENAIMYDGKNLAMVPEKDRGLTECITARMNDYRAMGSVPVELLDAVKVRVRRQEQEERHFEMIRDARLPLANIPKNERKDIMYDLCVEQDPNALAQIPEEKRNFERCMKQVALNGLNLRYVPDDKITSDLLNEALTQNGDAVKYAPDQMLTDKHLEMAYRSNPSSVDFLPEGQAESFEKKMELKEPMAEYFAMIEKDGRRLSEVPKKMRSKNLCMAAMKQNPRAIESVPEALRHGKIADMAIKHDGHLISEIPMQFRSEQLCEMALEKTPLAYKHMPNEYKSEKNTLRAVRSDGNLIRYTPDRLRTRSVKLAAVKQNGFAIEHLSQKQRTPEIIEAAVSQNGQVLAMLSEAQKTVEACALAVRQDESAWRWVPEKSRSTVRMVMDEMGQGRVTKQEDLSLVTENPRRLHDIPEERRTVRLCDAAMSRDPSVFPDVPQNCQFLQMAYSAVDRDPSQIANVRQDLLTPELVQRAIEKDATLIGKIPPEKLTEEHCMMAVSEKPELLGKLSKEMRTERVCLCAVQHDRSGKVMAHVPHAKKAFVKDQYQRNCAQVMQEYKERMKLFFEQKQAQSQKIIQKLNKKIEAKQEYFHGVEKTSKTFLNTLLHKKEFDKVLHSTKEVVRRCVKRLTFVKTHLSDENELMRMAKHQVRINNVDLTKRRDEIYQKNTQEKSRMQDLQRMCSRNERILQNQNVAHGFSL